MSNFEKTPFTPVKNQEEEKTELEEFESKLRRLTTQEIEEEIKKIGTSSSFKNIEDFANFLVSSHFSALNGIEDFDKEAEEKLESLPVEDKTKFKKIISLAREVERRKKETGRKETGRREEKSQDQKESQNELRKTEKNKAA